eukprot:65801-Amphidinium_carterae.1
MNLQSAPTNFHLKNNNRTNGHKEQKMTRTTTTTQVWKTAMVTWLDSPMANAASGKQHGVVAACDTLSSFNTSTVSLHPEGFDVVTHGVLTIFGGGLHQFLFQI